MQNQGNQSIYYQQECHRILEGLRNIDRPKWALYRELAIDAVVAAAGASAGLEPNTIDLHRFGVGEAMNCVKRRIDRLRNEVGASRLELIVGRGLHSPDGVARIKESIINLANGLGIPLEENQSNVGRVTLVIRGRQEPPVKQIQRERSGDCQCIIL